MPSQQQQQLTDFNEFFYTILFVSILSKIFFVTVPNYIDGMVVIAVKNNPGWYPNLKYLGGTYMHI